MRDPSGASVPSAAVAVTNPSKGIRRAFETNVAGVFSAPARGYTVTVNKQGCGAFEQ